jgi:signal transduction histidine kinase
VLIWVSDLDKGVTYVNQPWLKFTGRSLDEVKYAGVPDVSVALRCTQTDIELQVIDSGVGFDLESAGRPGLGLVSMKERLNLVGGQIRIESRPGAGTTVRARVPLESHITRDDALSNVRV